MVTQFDKSDLAQVERLDDTEDEGGNKLYKLTKPQLPGVKVKERSANQLKRLPQAAVEELLRPFLLEAIDNPDGVAALIDRLLLARREITALQALKTSKAKRGNRAGIGSTAAAGADLKGPAPEFRCSSCFAPWSEDAKSFTKCRNCQSTQPLTTLEEGLTYRAAGTEWRMVISSTGAQWVSDTKLTDELKDSN